MTDKSINLKNFIYGAGLSIGMRGFAVIAMFLMDLIISRSLGLDEAGFFFLGVTMVTFLSSIGRMGLEQTLVKNIAIFNNEKSFSKVRSIYKKSMFISLSLCTFLSLSLIFLWDPLVSKIFTTEGFKPVFILMMCCLPFFSLNILQAYVFQGAERIMTSLIFLNILIPIQVSIYVYLFEISSAVQSAQAFLLSSLTALIIGVIIWLTSIPRAADKKIISNRIIFKTSLPLWGYIILTQLILWYSQLILGIFGNAGEVAILAISQRISLLVSVMLLAVNNIVSPKFAKLFADGKIRELKRLTVWSVRLLLAAGLPIIAVIVIFPEKILSLFGREYTQGALVLIILAFGQLVNIMTGSVAMLLSMTKYERELRNKTIITAFIVLPFGFYLISSFGLIGAAITTSFSIALHNLLLALSVYSKLGINVLKFW